MNFLVIFFAIVVSSCAELANLTGSFSERKPHPVDLLKLKVDPTNIVVKSLEGKEKTYSSLKHAISKLKEGDLIMLPEGIFEGPFDFGKTRNITVVGKGRKTVLRSSVTSNEIVFKNLDFVAGGLTFTIKSGRVWLLNVNLRGYGAFKVEASNNYNPSNSALVWLVGTNENTKMDAGYLLSSTFGAGNAMHAMIGIQYNKGKNYETNKYIFEYKCSSGATLSNVLHDMDIFKRLCKEYEKGYQLSDGLMVDLENWILDNKVQTRLINEEYSGSVNNSVFKKVLVNRLVEAIVNREVSNTGNSVKMSFTAKDINSALNNGNYLTAALMAKKLSVYDRRSGEVLLSKAKDQISKKYSCKVFGTGSKYAQSKKYVGEYTKTFVRLIEQHTPLFAIANTSAATNCRVDIELDYTVTSTYSKSRYESKTYTRETVESSNRRRAAMNAARNAQLKASFAEASNSVSAAKQSWDSSINKTVKLEKTSNGYEMSYWKNKKNVSTMGPSITPKTYRVGSTEFETVTKVTEIGRCVERTFLRAPLKISSKFGETVKVNEEIKVVVENGPEKKRGSYNPCNVSYRNGVSHPFSRHLQSITIGYFEDYVNKFFVPKILAKIHNSKKSKYDEIESLLLSVGIGVDPQDFKKSQENFTKQFGMSPSEAIKELLVI